MLKALTGKNRFCLRFEFLTFQFLHIFYQSYFCVISNIWKKLYLSFLRFHNSVIIGCFSYNLLENSDDISSDSKYQNQMTTQLFQIFWPEYPIWFEKHQSSPNEISHSQTFLLNMFLLKLWNSNLKLTLGKMLQKLLSFWVTVQQPYSGKDSYRYEQNTPHWFLQIWTQ